MEEGFHRKRNEENEKGKLTGKRKIRLWNFGSTKTARPKGTTKKSGNGTSRAGSTKEIVGRKKKVTGTTAMHA